jgi:acetyltransferase-like isoleucine patch superfamily enzyme
MMHKLLDKNRRLYKFFFGLLPNKFLAGTMYHPNVSIASATYVHKNATIMSYVGGNISIGRQCIIHNGAMIVSQGGDITIGNNVSVNPYTVIYGGGGLEIQDGVRIASHVAIIPSNHVFDGIEVGKCLKKITAKGVVIESGVWLGAGVRVLDGVVIRKGSVIGAGAVVTKSTEVGGVYVGSPARLLRYRKT